MNSMKLLAKRITLLFAGILMLSWTAPRGLGSYPVFASPYRFGAGPAPSENHGSASLDRASRARVEWTLRHQSLSFIENRGQIDPRASFYVKGETTNVYFTSDGLMFTLSRPGRPASGQASSDRWTMKQRFIGTRTGVRPAGESETPTRVSYFRGSKDEWKTGLPTYSKILYSDLWPGIDLVYAGAENKLKYEFAVRPGADPSQIKWDYQGAYVSFDAAGDLQVTTPAGKLRDSRPYSYQERDGHRVQVATSYKIETVRGSSTQVCGFGVGRYDKSKLLLIDPSVAIAYAGYIGGDFVDTAFGIAVDAAGAAYVTGYTESTTSDHFPLTVGPGLSFNFNKSFLFWTAFVAKVKPDGSGLEYCGYIDGAGHQMGSAIAVDSSGAAYVTGFTTSDETTFPVSGGPSLKYSGSSRGGTSTNAYIGDAFVAKVKPDGTGLEYCGYIGGKGDDAGYGIAVDSAGNAYVTGESTSPGPSQVTGSASAPFPAKVGPSLTNSGAPNFTTPDAFIAKVKADGTSLIYAGFIGGTGVDQGIGVAVDGAGAAYVTGMTTSPSAGFSGLAVGPSLTPGGEMDAFVAKVKPDGSGLNYCGYIGGAKSDEGLGIAVDSAGHAFVTGETSSDQTTFPVKVGPKLTYSGTDGMLGDAFVAKVSTDGSSLIYCGYIGGSGGDAGYRIAVDSSGSAYVTGSTNSTASTFPVTAATGRAATYSGGTIFGDAFIAKVDPSGASLLYAGYLGGTDDDSGVGVAVDNSGDVYLSGATFSSQASFPVTVGPFLTYDPGIFQEADAFVAKLTGLPGPAADFSISISPSTITAQTRPTKVTVTITIARTGTFTGAVSISPPATLPKGIKVPLDTTPISGNTTSFKLKVKGAAQSGTDQLVFTAKDSSGNLVHAAALTVIVQ